MSEVTIRERFEAAKRRAKGRWRDIFVSAGIEESLLVKPNRPCPLCGGRDRFSFTDKYEAGNYLCRHCGHGDGFELLSRFLGISVFDALETVERFCGLPVPEHGTGRARQEWPKKDDAPHKTPYHLAIWQEAHPVVENDAVWKYLKNRGLNPLRVSGDIRTHEALLYGDETTEKTRWPAMLSRMTDKNGIVTAVHRTYLTEDGQKAPVTAVKKITSGTTNGAVVQLGRPVRVLGIAEGVETALAAGEWFHMPVWAAIGAENLANFEAVPESVMRLVIFGDNDRNFVGQEAAYRLAKRWAGRLPVVEVALPPTAGSDWLDEYLRDEAHIFA